MDAADGHAVDLAIRIAAAGLPVHDVAGAARLFNRCGVGKCVVVVL